MRMTGFTKRSLWECFIKVSSDRVEKRSMREKLHLRFRARSRPLKRVSHFISILSTLFSCAAALRKFFYHLNKPVMMCLRVNVQCANCFDLSRNKSDWHFIFIFTGHNRLLPRIAGVPFRLIHSIIFKSEAHTRESNYFDLPHVLLIHCGTLFYFFLFFYFSRTMRSNLFAFISAGWHSVVIRADVLAISAKISMQNVYTLRSKKVFTRIWRADALINFIEKCVCYQTLSIFFTHAFAWIIN